MSLFDYEDNRSEATDFSDLEAGDYTAEIKKAEIRTSQAGNKGFEIIFKLTEKGVKGREFRNWMNIWHPTKSVSGQAQRQLDSLGVALGENMDKLKSFNKIVGKKVTITLDFDDSRESFKNAVVNTKAIGGKASNATEGGADYEDDDIPF